jgi:probable phosphoglycerate mutase
MEVKRMTTIYLVRHAEAEGNLYRRCHGHYNSLITENGQRQIEALRQRFLTLPVDAVYSSDLYRTMTTARAIYGPKGLELHTTPQLREIGCGVWEDVPWANLERDYGSALMAHWNCQSDWQVEGSETFPAVRARMTKAILDIAAAHPDQCVAVVSHGSAIRSAVSGFFGVENKEVPLQENTAVTTLEIEDGVVTVKDMGDASHLNPEISTFAHLTRNSKKFPDGKNQLWFRVMDLPEESQLYCNCRHDAWLNIHKTEEGYDGQRFLSEALAHSAYDKSAVMVAMLGEEFVGLIQMDFEKDAERHIGCIPFCYLAPDFRAKGLGVQLLGQAVSTYRKLGRTKLRLRCAPDNVPAQGFYHKYGFYKVGMAENSVVPLELLDKNIGFD